MTEPFEERGTMKVSEQTWGKYQEILKIIKLFISPRKFVG